ncbi:hypothetical protein M9H77_26550 [Catharanthus roseus]|uniref:Uncharacterized protein n=1 Tax=Catharanthus roseus TaxID=4058 RepID=A0ACC0ABD9_CATRO|nr:hypothetical protein M9H77_26550 [Catharanthus roseus]
MPTTVLFQVPPPLYCPMFVISTLSALVTSQSMISASFSIIKQSIALGCFPRVTIVHTSSEHQGQSSDSIKGGVELANAYGVVVIWVMIITTLMTILVMIVIWNTHILLILAFFLPYIFIEAIFMTPLINKIPQRVMISWSYRRSMKSMYEAEQKMSLSELNQILSSSSIYRTLGICFFFADLVNGFHLLFAITSHIQILYVK